MRLALVDDVTRVFAGQPLYQVLERTHLQATPRPSPPPAGSIVGWPLVLVILGGAAFAASLVPKGPRYWRGDRA